MGSASSNQGPLQQQPVATGPGGGYSAPQPTATATVPAETSHNPGSSTGGHYPMEQWLVADTPALATTCTTSAGEGYAGPALGTWGYASTAAPSNGPWRPRYAPVYDPYTDPWHEDEEVDPPLPAVQGHMQQAWAMGTAIMDEGGNCKDNRPRGSQQAPLTPSPRPGAKHKLPSLRGNTLIQGSATYQAHRLSAIQAQQARPAECGPALPTPTGRPQQPGTTKPAAPARGAAHARPAGGSRNPATTSTAAAAAREDQGA